MGSNFDEAFINNDQLLTAFSELKDEIKEGFDALDLKIDRLSSSPIPSEILDESQEDKSDQKISNDWSPRFSKTLISDSSNRIKDSARVATMQGRKYTPRPSLLTELFRVSHIASLYNMFLATLVLLLINILVNDLMSTGSVNLGMVHFFWCFEGLNHVINVWICMFFSSSVLLYSGFYLWAHKRHLNNRIFDYAFGLLYLLYLVLFLYWPTERLLHYDLPIASSFIILMEQVRLFMKSWAFVRGNLWRVFPEERQNSNVSDSQNIVKNDPGIEDECGLRRRKNEKTIKPEKEESEVEHSLSPHFSHYLYFHFAPTLVYRDSYPMTPTVIWSRVVRDLSQVVGCIFYAHFLFVRFCVPVFEQFGAGLHMSPSELTVSVFMCCFPGFMVLLCTFFAILHAWLNAFAEMMRFADRMFYKDWWNSSSYSRFYRTWNCVVHDWLYEYVYIEAYNRIKPGKLQKTTSMLLVFLISALVHEYIIAIAFRFFYPVLLLLFGGFGVAFMFLKTKGPTFNVFLWITLILGTGVLMCLYSLEWYARRNCSPYSDGALDYVVPRSWFCVPLKS